MSNMLGGGAGQPVATQATRYNGMQVQASQYGMGLPIVYGQQRIAGTLIWYGDFQSIEHKQSVGKGGGGVSTSYTYSSSFQLALCEGPIAGIPTIWKDSGTTSFSDINGTYSLGTQNQAAWSHLSGSDALQYPYTAWVGCLNLALGSSPNVPNFNFEIAGLLQYDPTGSPAIIDADPSAIFSDLLTSTTHGLNFSAFLGDLTLYHDYCVANSIFLSLVVDQQTTMNEILTRLLQVTNSNTAWSNGKLIVIPYGDETVTGNGVTYTPPTTVQKYFTDSDYIKPVRVDQKPLSDLYNVVRVEYVNRANNYNTSVAEAKDQADIDNAFGIRQQEMIQGHAITNPTLAQWVAQILLQRALYIRNTYTFTTTMENVAFEPGDVIALSDSLAGLVNEPVRIKSISEQGTNELQFVCEEFPAGVASGATQSVEAPAGYVPSVNGSPDATQPPVIFRAPQFLTDGTPEVWIGVGGAGPNWGGANVLVSLDNVSYSKIGTVSPGCRYGTLTAALASGSDPDTVNSFSVALDAGGTLSGGSQAEADNLSTLMLVDQELVAYSATTLNADGTYTLGTYLRRGCYQTAIPASHAIGAPWLRVDDSVFRWQVDPSLVGTTVYIKIQPWNLYGGGLVSESSLTPTTYVIGTAEEIPDTPPVPQNFAAAGAANGALITWENTNPAAVAITSVEYSPDGTTWTVLGQVQGTHYTHAFFGNATHYYRARARSPAFIWSAYTSTVQVGGGSIDYVASESVGTLVQLVSAARTVAQNIVNGGALSQYTELLGAVAYPANIEFDVYANAGTMNIFVATTSAPDGYIFRFDGRSGYARGQILIVTNGTYSNIGTQMNGTASAAASGWHHVLFRYNPNSGDHYVYVDGILECVAHDTTYLVSASNIYAGQALGTSMPIAPSTFYGGFLDSAQRVSTPAGAVSPTGSIVTGSSSVVFSYTSTTSSITISWTAGTIYRMDGTTTSVGSGSTNITGLNASANYYAAAYYDEVAGAIAFVTGQSGAVGTPAILYPSESSVVAWQAQLQARMNLGWIPVSTPASGTGGGNGASGCCLRGQQLIELASGIMRAAEDLRVGDVLSSPEGGTRITQLRIEPWREWYVVEFNDGRTLEVAPDHRFVDPSGVQIHARDLKLQDIVQGRDCYLSVARLELATDAAAKVGIEVESPHVYFVDGVLSHNKVYC